MMNMTQLSVHRAAAICGAVTMVLLGAACGGGSGQTDSTSPDVWAVVDGRQILRAEVDKTYRGMTVGAAAAPSLEELLNLKLNILDELITQDILLAKAREVGVEATDVEIDNALAEQKRSMSEEEFQAQLAERGLTVEDIRTGLRREISGQKVVDREIVSQISVTDDDIADFYNANREQFNLSEPHFRLAQILVTPQLDPNTQNRMNDDAGSADAAKLKAEMLTQRLQAGADFAQLALDYSEDPQTVAQGGDLGLVPESALANLPAALRTAVRTMEPGTASTLSLGTNYVVLMLVSREPAGQRELGTAAVRDGIRDLLRTRREQLLQQAYVTHLRETSAVDNRLARLIVETQGKVPGQVVEAPPASAATTAAPSEAPAADGSE